MPPSKPAPSKPRPKFNKGDEVEVTTGMCKGRAGVIVRSTWTVKSPQRHGRFVTTNRPEDYTYRYSVKIGDDPVRQYRESGLVLATPLSEEDLLDAQRATQEMLRDLRATSVSP